MFKSIEDIFNNPKVTFNDPLYEIHNPVQPCDHEPNIDEYEEFMNSLDANVYPKPKDKFIHNIIDPLHGALKPICINNK